MKSHPICDLRLIGPHIPDDLLTEEQRAFAIVLGRILAEQWEQRQRHSATGAMSLPGQPRHPEEGSGQKVPSDGD